MLQWFWFGTAADQTYESCVDMVVAGVNSTSAAVNGSATSKSTEATLSNTAVASGARRSKNLLRFRARA